MGRREDFNVMQRSARLAETEPKPPTLRSVEIAPAAVPEEGKKNDTGKTMTHLLPMGSLSAANEMLLREPVISDEPWAVLQDSLVTWRTSDRKSQRSINAMARVAACLLVLLTRDLRGNVRISRLFPECGPAMLEVAKVLTFGAEKYGPNNWQKLSDFALRYYAAALRHLFAYGAGEITDPESGLPHLAHAACGALFLLSAEVGHDPVDMASTASI